MTRTLSNAAKQELFAQESGEVWLALITIDHADFTEPMRVANDPMQQLPVAGVRGVVSRGEEYSYMPFTLQLPSQDDTGSGRVQLKIDNVDRRIVKAVRRAGRCTLTIEVVRASEPDEPEMTLPEMVLDNVKHNVLEVSGDVSTEYYDLEPFPSRRFTPSDFPGLF